VGSSPPGRANSIRTRVSAIETPQERAEKANAHPLHEAIEAFLLTKRVGGCTAPTLTTYRWWLERFAAAVPEVAPLTVRTFFAGLQHRSASHQCSAPQLDETLREA